jgi:hypothetical protein
MTFGAVNARMGLAWLLATASPPAVIAVATRMPSAWLTLMPPPAAIDAVRARPTPSA